ncbi:hypothetical protein GCM10010232_35510 [Streptomyces amakusaensis]
MPGGKGDPGGVAVTVRKGYDATITSGGGSEVSPGVPRNAGSWRRCSTGPVEGREGVHAGPGWCGWVPVGARRGDGEPARVLRGGGLVGQSGSAWSRKGVELRRRVAP